jgi:hypothetical protein
MHGLLDPPFDRLIEIMANIRRSDPDFSGQCPYVGRLEFGGKDRLRRIQNGGSLRVIQDVR